MIGALLLLAVSVVPAGQEFTCTPVRVWMAMGLYGALRDPVSGLLALPPVRLMIVAVLTNRAQMPLLSKPAMPL